MSYTQNNPFSRKSSPLNKDDKWIQKATASIKERGTEGVCTGDKFGGPTCPPGSKRYNLAKTFKAMAKKGDGVSRKPSEKPSEKPSTKPVEETRMTKGDQMPSRKSSSPINHGDGSGLSPQDEEMMAARTAFSDQMPSEGDYTQEQYDTYDTKLNAIRSKYNTGPSRKSSSPLNNTGMTGLNYSKELQYMPIEDDMHRGMSRESSSPLDYGSWANEDATRAKELYKKGDYAYARALGVDEHDADYGKWKSSEAEHGPSRKSRSERLRSRAMKRSERSGAEWGDYDYEDKRVQKMLSKASELDERSGNVNTGGNEVLYEETSRMIDERGGSRN